MNNILNIKNLKIEFNTTEGIVKAVDNVSMKIGTKEIVGIIGETGCGKSVLGHSILRLLPSSASVQGEVIFKDKNLYNISMDKMREIRGAEIGLIMQNPSEALNPLIKNGNQIIEGMQCHKKRSKFECWKSAESLLDSLKLKNSKLAMKQYPHQMSGGMKQRILAAVGMSSHPKLLIADEPTKGLDSLIRGEVVNVLSKLKEEFNTSIFLITHDLKVASYLCDKIAVMYAGEILEQGNSKELFSNPAHPYLKGVISSLPSKGMNVLNGYSPSLINIPKGCKFYNRCIYRKNECMIEDIKMKKLSDDHEVRCINI